MISTMTTSWSASSRRSDPAEEGRTLGAGEGGEEEQEKEGAGVGAGEKPKVAGRGH